jgi:hypothetical protein
MMPLIDQDEMRRRYPQLGGSKFVPATSLDIDRPLKTREHGKPIHSVTLPINLTNDNRGRSQHWTKANKRKAEYLQVLAEHLCVRNKYFPRGVKLVITRILGKGQRLWDPDSICRGSVKELVDALVQSHWFEDDGPEFIAQVIGKQDAEFRSDGPAVEIEVCI